jgi:hypothetical protein
MQLLGSVAMLQKDAPVVIALGIVGFWNMMPRIAAWLPVDQLLSSVRDPAQWHHAFLATSWLPLASFGQRLIVPLLETSASKPLPPPGVLVGAEDGNIQVDGR